MNKLNTIITVSKEAIEKISDILSKESKNSMFRISLEGGGCSGFKYKFNIDDEYNKKNDFLFKESNIKIVIDKISLQYIKGSQIHFVDNIMMQSFQINNPNANSSCGCGTSFSI